MKTILPPSESVLTSTRNVVDKIKDQAITGKIILASLDIVLVYPSINVEEIKPFIKNYLDTVPISDMHIKNTIHCKKKICKVTKNILGNWDA